MSYENAPATALVATNCFACGRALLDAESIAWGVGPVCRGNAVKKLTDTERAAANKITHAVARLYHAGETGAAVTEALKLREFGCFGGLIDRLVRNVVKVEIVESDGFFYVRAPFKGEALDAWRNVGRWTGKETGWKVTTMNRPQLWALLQKYYAGQAGLSEQGAFTIPESA